MDKLEDLKVLKRSPDLLNNIKIGFGQLQLIMKYILFYHIWGLWPFWSSDPPLTLLRLILVAPIHIPVCKRRDFLSSSVVSGSCKLLVSCSFA